MMHWNGFGGMGFGGFGFGWIFMVIFWIAVIAGVVYLVKLILGNSSPKEHNDTAVDILRQRFAAGEINRDEFDRRMRLLKKE